MFKTTVGEISNFSAYIPLLQHGINRTILQEKACILPLQQIRHSVVPTSLYSKVFQTTYSLSMNTMNFSFDHLHLIATLTLLAPRLAN